MKPSSASHDGHLSALLARLRGGELLRHQMKDVLEMFRPMLVKVNIDREITDRIAAISRTLKCSVTNHPSVLGL